MSRRRCTKYRYAVSTCLTGVLCPLQAEMRAAVFLAMEEQDRLEVTVSFRCSWFSCCSSGAPVYFVLCSPQNKSPLINENLKKSLSTKDGQCVAPLCLLPCVAGYYLLRGQKSSVVAVHVCHQAVEL